MKEIQGRASCHKCSEMAEELFLLVVKRPTTRYYDCAPGARRVDRLCEAGLRARADGATTFALSIL